MTTQMPKTAQGMLDLTEQRLAALKPTDFPDDFDLPKYCNELAGFHMANRYGTLGNAVVALIGEQPQDEYAFVLAYRELVRQQNQRRNK